MEKFDITITEVYAKTISVEAEDYADAKRKAQDMWYDSEVVLHDKDFQDVSFT